MHILKQCYPDRPPLELFLAPVVTVQQQSVREGGVKCMPLNTLLELSAKPIVT